MSNIVPYVPHEVGSEEAVLGMALAYPYCLEELDFVDFTLRAEDFYIVRHAWIWEAIRYLQAHYENVDAPMVASRLENQGRLPEIGGAAYLLELIAKTPSALAFTSYARRVWEMASRRSLIEASSQIVRLAHSEDTEVEEVVVRATNLLKEIELRSITSDTYVLSELVDADLERLKRAQKGDTRFGIRSFITELDRILGYLMNEDLIVLAGRPGMAKTGVACQIAHNILTNTGLPVGFISLEQSAESLAWRMIAIGGGVHLKRLQTARLSPADMDAYTTYYHQVRELPMHITDDPRTTITQIENQARRWKRDYDIPVLLIDYLQLINIGAVGEVDKTSRRSVVAYYTRSLKQLARELRIPVVVLAQLNRDCEKRQDKRPLLSDLGESGTIEQDADVIMFLYRDEYYGLGNPGILEIDVAKHRNGPTGRIKVQLDLEHSRVRDLVRKIVNLDIPDEEGVWRGAKE